MILHVRVVTGTGGGPEKTILNSPRHLERLGYQSRCVFLHPPGDPGIEDIARRGRALGTEIIAIPDRGPFDLQSMRELRRVCRRLNTRVWHAHDYKTNVLGLMLRPFQRMHLATTAHGWGAIVGRVPLYNRIDMKALPRYERVVCVSEDIAEICRNAGVKSERIAVIENAIDLEHYQRDDDGMVVRRELGIPEDEFTVGAVGRLSPEKGFDLLIQAIHQLRSRGHNIGLAIAGAGPDEGRLREMISKLPDSTRYRLLGHQSNVTRLYSAFNLYALSSLSEGLPNVLLEALAMRLPVVATRVGGVPNVLTDGSTGLLIPPGDVTALANAMETLFSDPKRIEQLTDNGFQLIESRYSFANRMRAMCDVYRSIGIQPIG